jgi:hypothetical protein
VCLCEAFEKFKVQVKRGIFVITEKPRVVFAKCNWIGGNFKISEGWFCKHVFLTLSYVKIYIYIFIQKAAFEKCVLKYVKILGKVVRIRVFI